MGGRGAERRYGVPMGSTTSEDGELDPLLPSVAELAIFGLSCLLVLALLVWLVVRLVRRSRRRDVGEQRRQRG